MPDGILILVESKCRDLEDSTTETDNDFLSSVIKESTWTLTQTIEKMPKTLGMAQNLCRREHLDLYEDGLLASQPSSHDP